ncbi:hypothetical protein FQN52_001754 [Onygenales sp. PD_12]|nr:hypothetical protein FQN52_001754 [Onygenales sp. PD_12]
MAQQYINYLKSKAHHLSSSSPKTPPTEADAAQQQDPVLSPDDEAFLHRVTSPGEGDAQTAAMDGARNVPLPLEPEGSEGPVGEPVKSGGDGGVGRGVSKEIEEEGEKSLKDKKGKKGKGPLGWVRHGLEMRKKENTAAGLSHIAENLKSPDAKPEGTTAVVSAEEVEKEEEDLTAILERLNLAAVNNRAFSISDETQELLKKFNVILKDLINGVPTAYHDLESLLTNDDGQLQKAFNHLPGFLQKLVEQLPDKMTEHFGPEFLAAAAEKAGKSGINTEEARKAAATAKKMGLKIPSLKELVGKPAAIAGMLRSIVTFLQTRFPALMGMNVLMSLALFILLFVLWYCHKRGREVRLEKERILTKQEIEKLNAEDATINASETMTTTAAEGSTIDQVRAGVREAQAAREAALLTGPGPTASDSVSVSSPASEAESQSQPRRPIPKI